MGTLDSLVTATDDLLKADQLAEAAIGKIVENIRTLFVSNDNKVINNTGDPLKNALMVNDSKLFGIVCT